MAKLFFRYGAMNSGKSTALLQVAHNYEERGMHVLLIKPRLDTKGSQHIVARIGIDRAVDILADDSMNLRSQVMQWSKDVDKINCVLVDEAQFLSANHIDQLFELAVLDGIPVICFGLRTDFQRNLFPGSERLFALAHSLEELKTICRCGKKALFVGRKVNEHYVFDGSQVAIDGENEVTYESLCGNCYLQEKTVVVD
jgi:thymidine kinase